MNAINFKYLQSISKKHIESIEELICDERLLNHLWIEIIVNPDIVNVLFPYVENAKIKKAFEDALSWYLAFNWIFPTNIPLEQLHKKGIISYYRVKLKNYMQNRRNFIKGLIHEGLC
ncbi:hypothetical protein TAGGR_1636 [Thermodesulfovibrio aggregans]|uniref:Uncharacterized protein n=1 Tax=Thermodesulfovibrio aggregans TaxID=86166 RepID=A0A0U9HN17_9BACT|nr:hypothetical protein [Thermodesulfovibrio aggregans]GAQ94455.1 hypothetical protein TAGGR_1636 [Thermodesulfovibrio aggregans]